MNIDAQQRFLSLAKQFESLQEQVEAVRTELTVAMQQLKVGSFVQDSETGVVYKIVKPLGRFTYYSDIDYNRTTLPNETRGSLSKKEAQEAGFVLSK